MQLTILGAGAVARDAYFLANGMYPGVDIVFIDTTRETGILSIGDRQFSVLNKPNKSCFDFIVCVGCPRVKRILVELALQMGLKPAPTLIHPNAVIYDCEVGRGGLIYPNCVVMNNTTLGDYVLINANCVIGHNAIVGNYVSQNPLSMIGSNVHVGDGCWIGATSFVKENTTLGEGTMVGASACVTKDTPSHSTVVGVPARVRTISQA